MRNSVTFFIFLVFSISCSAQKMVVKTTDAKKLEINETFFIGKPLKILLAEISPEIKTVSASPADNIVNPSTISFYFVSVEEYYNYRKLDKFPPSIKVYIRGDFDWDRRGLSKEDMLKWTKKDAEKYANLIVGAVRVY
jgi:hypothetical protein